MDCIPKLVHSITYPMILNKTKYTKQKLNFRGPPFSMFLINPDRFSFWGHEQPNLRCVIFLTLCLRRNVGKSPFAPLTFFLTLHNFKKKSLFH